MHNLVRISFRCSGGWLKKSSGFVAVFIVIAFFASSGLVVAGPVKTGGGSSGSSSDGDPKRPRNATSPPSAPISHPGLHFQYLVDQDIEGLLAFERKAARLAGRTPWSLADFEDRFGPLHEKRRRNVVPMLIREILEIVGYVLSEKDPKAKFLNVAKIEIDPSLPADVAETLVRRTLVNLRDLAIRSRYRGLTFNPEAVSKISPSLRETMKLRTPAPDLLSRVPSTAELVDDFEFDLRQKIYTAALEEHDLYDRLMLPENFSPGDLELAAKTLRYYGLEKDQRAISAFSILGDDKRRTEHHRNLRLPIPSPATREIPRYGEPNPYSPNLYARLGVGENSSPDVVRIAGIRARQQFKGPDQERSRIQQASTILDSPLRTHYDEASRNIQNSEAFLQSLSQRAALLAEAMATPEKLLVDHSWKATPAAPDLYGRLGVPRNASVELIWSRYLALIAKAKAAQDADAIIRLQEAIQILSDNSLRADYDAAVGGFLDNPQTVRPERIEEVVRGILQTAKYDDRVDDHLNTLLIPFDEPGAEPPQHPFRPDELDFYARIGVEPNASQRVILEQERSLRRIFYILTEGMDLQPLLDSFAVLKHPQLRVHYDALERSERAKPEEESVQRLVEKGHAYERGEYFRQETANDRSLPQLLESATMLIPTLEGVPQSPKILSPFIDNLKNKLRHMSLSSTGDNEMSVLHQVSTIVTTMATLAEKSDVSYRDSILKQSARLIDDVTRLRRRLLKRASRAGCAELLSQLMNNLPPLHE